MHISYTIVDSPLDWLLLAASKQGICHISLGDTAGELEAALTKTYPEATRQPEQSADSDLCRWTGDLLGYLQGQQPQPDVPLDLQATPFQQHVWRELRDIPAGSTRSYRQLAQERLGNPGAARAVARACASNPVALLVPCHRVVREDGSPGGYRWGIERKRRLLAWEAQSLRQGFLSSLQQPASGSASLPGDEHYQQAAFLDGA
jgi:AraC family transcriptional regulator of adaptative response/methylated-DNA-[protein]-cysteine methyltransferase